MIDPSNDTEARSVFDRALLLLLIAARGVAGLAVLSCSVLATVDTIGLWIFGSPVPSVVEITQMLLVVIVFFGLAAAERGGDHITVDIVRDRLPKAARRVSNLIVQITSLCVYFGLCAAGTVSAIRSWNVNEVSEGLIELPAFPFRFILVVGAFLAFFAAWSVVLRPHRSRPYSDAVGD